MLMDELKGASTGAHHRQAGREKGKSGAILILQPEAPLCPLLISYRRPGGGRSIEPLLMKEQIDSFFMEALEHAEQVGQHTKKKASHIALAPRCAPRSARAECL
jgi:hypothetical protein